MTPQQWAKNLLAYPDKYCILDTETTGLHNAQPVDIGVIDLLSKVLVTLRVKPSIPITQGATDVHGITNQDVKDAPSFADIFDDFCWAIGDRTLLIYNAPYDLGVLRNACRAYGLTYPDFQAECVMLQYSEFVGEWNHRYGNYKWQKLQSGDHSALGDCRATLKVIQRMANAQIQT
jgi:DNA polymerase-3 subunit epsilon